MKIEANSSAVQGELQGLCGGFGEEELRTPSGDVARNPLNFVQSWVHTKGPCERGKQVLITLLFSLISLLS